MGNVRFKKPAKLGMHNPKNSTFVYPLPNLAKLAKIATSEVNFLSTFSQQPLCLNR
jgi:hypothetical protein